LWRNEVGSRATCCNQGAYGLPAGGAQQLH
jgi:hypothetical protein